MSGRHPLARKCLSLLLPHFCPVCSAPAEDYLCVHCENALKPLHSACALCALPLTDDCIDALCADCLKSSPSFDRCICAFEYDTLCGRLIKAFKDGADYGAGAYLLKPLAQRISHYYEAHPYTDFPQALIPIPVHWKKNLARGFNHSDYLCDLLQKQIKIPKLQLFKKIHESLDQKDLNREQRLKNLSGSFKQDTISTQFDHIALIDDVVTTGATANVLASMLKKEA